MKAFSGKSKTGFLDWAKMEFRRGDINEFIDTIAGYKSTISVGLGTITMRTTKVSQQVIEEYNEIIMDTAYSLEMHLRRIDEKMAQITTDDTNTSDITIDLSDERAVTKQCLRICEDARSYIESLADKETTVLEENPGNAGKDNVSEYFEAQLLTRQALSKSRDNFTEIITHLQGRLASVVLTGGSADNNERLQLQQDINISKQCLEVCKLASEVSNQKIYRVGEAVADGDSDQVVVTTIADLFDVKKALSKGNSAQLVGSMGEESLRHLADQRYSSRFGALTDEVRPSQARTSSPPRVVSSPKNQDTVPRRTDDGNQSPGPDTRRDRPSPNEMRKRAMGGDN